MVTLQEDVSFVSCYDILYSHEICKQNRLNLGVTSQTKFWCYTEDVTGFWITCSSNQVGS